MLLPGRENVRRKSGAVERGPEAIARTAEVMTDGGGVESRIDPAEENIEFVGDQVRNGEMDRRGKFGLRWFEDAFPSHNGFC